MTSSSLVAHIHSDAVLKRPFHISAFVEDHNAWLKLSSITLGSCAHVCRSRDCIGLELKPCLHVWLPHKWGWIFQSGLIFSPFSVRSLASLADHMQHWIGSRLLRWTSLHSLCLQIKQRHRLRLCENTSFSSRLVIWGIPHRMLPVGSFE